MAGQKRSLFVVQDPLRLIKLGDIKSKKVVLLACPWIFFNEMEFQSQQLALGYLGAYAARFGHEIVAYIDPMVGEGGKHKHPVGTMQKSAYRFGFPDEWIIARIPPDADVIAINAPFTDSRLALYPLVRKIKAVYPAKQIIVGGILAHTQPEQILEECGADIAVRGEGEIAFVRILNGEPLSSIPGTVYRDEHGRIRDTGGLAEEFQNVNDLPLPGYDFRPMSEYVRLSTWGNKINRTLHLITSRGCPFNCSFCSTPQQKQPLRTFSPERVLGEIKMAIENWNINFIEIADDNFTLDRDHAVAILSGIAELREQGHDLHCAFPNGVMIEKMDKDLAVFMKRAGTEILYLPVEAGDTRILVAMNKPNAFNHLQKAKEVAQICVDVGLPVGCFLILAYPGGRMLSRNFIIPEYEKYFWREGNAVYMRGEDEESFTITVKFCEEMQNIGVHGITPLIATPLPNTEMHGFCKKFGYLSLPDSEILVTVSYADVTPDVVSIETPWCSRKQAFERWRYLMDNFQTYHNVRKRELNEGLMSGLDIRKKD